MPKPLIPLGNGECALGRILSILSDLNFTKIVVNTHHLADQIREYCSKKYPNVVISHEDKILETGGAFVKALTHFDQKQPVLAINGDIYKEDLNKSIKDLYEAYDSEKMDFLLGLVDKNDVIGPRHVGFAARVRYRGSRIVGDHGAHTGYPGEEHALAHVGLPD